MSYPGPDRAFHIKCRRCWRWFVGSSGNQKWCDDCGPKARRAYLRAWNAKRSGQAPVEEPKKSGKPFIVDPRWPVIFAEAKRELEAKEHVRLFTLVDTGTATELQPGRKWP